MNDSPFFFNEILITAIKFPIYFPANVVEQLTSSFVKPNHSPLMTTLKKTNLYGAKILSRASFLYIITPLVNTLSSSSFESVFVIISIVLTSGRCSSTTAFISMSTLFAIVSVGFSIEVPGCLDV